MHHVRGAEIAMVFQDPMTSLNPVFTVGFQITETPKLHLRMDDRDAKEQAKELPDPVIEEQRKRIIFEKSPEYREVGPGHSCACHLVQ